MILNAEEIDKNQRDNIVEENEDSPSKHGRFGWTNIGKVILPYLFRSDGTKYVSVRMVEMTPTTHLSKFFNPGYLTYGRIMKYHAKIEETDLLNYINSKHLCYNHFGSTKFEVEQDLLMKLSDLNELITFVKTCYDKLHSPTVDRNPPLNNDRCGFIKIDLMFVVPFIVANNVKYLPAFYFEGDIDKLLARGIQITGWDLAYLKFCFKVQGIQRDYFTDETYLVVPLEEVKSHFTETTKFENYWPIESELIIARQEAIKSENICDTRLIATSSNISSAN